jgi:hypothetical protein
MTLFKLNNNVKPFKTTNAYGLREIITEKDI